MKYIGILGLLAAVGCGDVSAPGNLPIEEVQGAVTITHPETVTACAVPLAAPVLTDNGQSIGKSPFGVIWGNNDGTAYDVAPTTSTAAPETYALKWNLVGSNVTQWGNDWGAGFKRFFTAVPNIMGSNITINNVNYRESGCVGEFNNGDQFRVLYDVLGGTQLHNHFYLPLSGQEHKASGNLAPWGGQAGPYSAILESPTGSRAGTRLAVHLDTSNNEVTESMFTCPREPVSVFHYDQRAGVVTGTTTLQISAGFNSYLANSDGTVTICVAPKYAVGSGIAYTDVYLAMTHVGDGALRWLRPIEITRDSGANQVKDWNTSNNEIVAIWATPPGNMISGDSVAYQSNGLGAVSSDGSTFYHLELRSLSQVGSTAAQIQSLWWASMAAEATVHSTVGQGP